jgi:acyl-CoA thioester hydrolase
MLEAARVDTLREIGWVYSQMEKEGVLLPVVDLNMKYLVPARYDEILRVECHVLERPTSRLKFAFRIMHKDVLLVKAEVCLAFVDANTGRPRRAPEGLVVSLEKYSLIHSVAV